MLSFASLTVHAGRGCKVVQGHAADVTICSPRVTSISINRRLSAASTATRRRLLYGCSLNTYPSFCRSASPALAGMYLSEVLALLLDGQLEAVPTGEADLLAVRS